MKYEIFDIDKCFKDSVNKDSVNKDSSNKDSGNKDSDNKDSSIREKTEGFFKKQYKKYLGSPCEWADWLKCEKITTKSILEIHDAIKEYKDITQSQYGGSKVTNFLNNQELKEEYKRVDDYIEKLDLAIKIANKLKKQTENDEKQLKLNRIRAAAALNYIIRLFSLDLQDNLNVIKSHVNDKYNKSLANVMKNMTSYIKDTRPE